MGFHSVEMQRIRRRSVLLGLGGVALALPLLQFPSGSAQALPFPKRLVIFFSANGTIGDAWKPIGTETDFTLPYILQPLAPHQADLIVFDGVDMESSYHGVTANPHWKAMGNMLTGIELADHDHVFSGGGISVDQFIAQSVGQSTKLSSLELAVESLESSITSRMSYLGPSQPVPPESDPWKAYARLFHEISPAVRAQRKSVLDFVAGDITRLETQLASADRQKLQAHLTAIRDIETRLDALPHLSCTLPVLGQVVDPNDAEQFPTIGRLQMDLLVAALACDATRVATLQWSGARSETVFSWLGVADPHHTLSHLPIDDAVAQQTLADINRWYATQFAYLLSAMKAVPEGDGTLLDHSVVLWCNELSQGEVHSRRDMRYVLAGSCGGYFKTGRLLHYGGVEQGDTHNNLLVSLCHAMDLPVTSFGNPDYCTGPLGGLQG